MSVLSGIVGGIDVHRTFLVVAVLDSHRPDEPLESVKFGTTFLPTERSRTVSAGAWG